MNGFLGFWNEEGEWIYDSAIGFLRGFFLETIGKGFLACSNGTWIMEHWYVFTSISPFFMFSIHLQIEKKSSWVTHACIDLFLPRTYKNLALACNKKWDDGRREMIGLSSPNTYEKKQQAITYKTNPKKNKQSKIHFIPAGEQRPSRLTNSILIIASSFRVPFEWFQIQMKVNS